MLSSVFGLLRCIISFFFFFFAFWGRFSTFPSDPLSNGPSFSDLQKKKAGSSFYCLESEAKES